jgi:ABC-type antimicrobial peptide transport system permease subunit
MIHSSDPAKTAAWLEAEILPLIDAEGYVSPEIVLGNIIRNYATDIITELLTLALLLVIMSICMYFIMRASLLNRIKEVGIYRAIGVSKRNLIFKFFIEAIVLTALTVLIGYLVTSGFILACFHMSSLMEEGFFYPLWLAGADLFILALISLFFGTLPILSLLRSTPSEILAKYDI